MNILKKQLGSYCFLLFSCLLQAEYQEEEIAPEMQIVVKSEKTQKINLGLAIIGPDDAGLKECALRLEKDLLWSGQCQLHIEHKDSLSHVSELKTMFPESVSLALFLSKSNNTFTWRLYDLTTQQMVVGKIVTKNTESINLIAHMIADQVWPELFGHKSSFASKIAFCKQIWRKKHKQDKPYKQIWVADFDGSNAQLFIDVPTVSFAPRWNNNLEFPLLFYSENTLSNVQLVMSNMFSKRKVVCCFDGLNMQPTFSQDGKQVVFCLSKDGTSQLYLSYIDPFLEKRVYDRLTFNTGNNIAPCFVDKNHVAFASDHETHKPQIYILDLVSKSLERITDGGYCACPNYSFVRHQLVYSKMMGRAMQLFIYDFKTQQHHQLTDSSGSKEEPSWSACGNYIVFGLNEGYKSRIAQFNMITRKIHYLTSDKDHCTYPDCSPLYSKHIGILNN